MLMKTLVLVSVMIAGTSAVGSSLSWSPFGIVEGITDCGSKGKFGAVQVTDCSTLPCQVNPNTIYDVSIRITSSITSDNLYLQVVKSDDFTIILELPIDGEIEAGKEYELKFQIAVSTAFSGMEFPIRFYVWGNWGAEICAAASVKVL